MDRTRRAQALLAAGRRAWAELDRRGQPGLCGLAKVDVYLAAQLLERWLRCSRANEA